MQHAPEAQIRTRCYHYTSRLHLSHIMEAGYLQPSESNVSLRTPRAGPDVVWVYMSPDWPRLTEMLLGGVVNKSGGVSPVDKTEVRFVLELPDGGVAEWSSWAVRQGMNRKDRRTLASTGDGAEGEWGVVERSVPSSEWVDIELRPDLIGDTTT